MNPLFALVPAPYRWLMLAVAAIAFGSLCFYKGASFEQAQQARRELAAERASVKLAERRAAVGVKVEKKYAPQITQIRTVTKTLIKEVDRYVPVADCPLPPGFRVFHDAAASGEVPDAARIADAAAVTAQEAARTVADNYGSCREDLKRFEALQEWVREQQALNPKE